MIRLPHCPRDVAVRMREVLARTWVGVCVLLALISWHTIHGNSWFTFPTHVVGELTWLSSHVCWLELALKGVTSAVKGLRDTSFPRSSISPNKGETVVNGYHCLRDMAVRMREVLARPWFGLCVPLALSCFIFYGNFGLCYRIYFNLFFINYCNFLHL